MADEKTQTGVRAPPMIEIRDLHKSFGDHKVLTGINLEIPPGSTLVILGGSGSGKTVLMKHMIGLLKPDQGQVIVDGEDIVPMGALELEKLRRKFGMVFQAGALFDSMTVYENVSFPLREHRKDLPEEQMRELVRQLEECKSPRTCPHGRPTVIQLPAAELEKAFGRT